MAENGQMEKDKVKNLEQETIENPWRNVYWFSRMLINGDKYGAVGKDSKTLAGITAQLRLILEAKNQSDAVKVETSKATIRNILKKRFENATSIAKRIQLFSDDLDAKLETPTDIAVFILTAESVLIPINNALTGIPNNDREFTVARAKAYLDKLGEKGLATVINIWDDIGVAGSLTAERIAVLREFTNIRREISKMPETETNLVLTAFMQEFERRLGQKRKGRAGGSLEDVASFIFDYYEIEATHAPEHFQADIEVDKWVKCKDKWLIGISCKRTLRERWKQVSSADRGVLSKYKIKQVWHLITYDEDLSDDKLTLLGNLGHIFYLRDDSRMLKHAKSHVGMKDYVRPMSKFVIDIIKEQNN